MAETRLDKFDNLMLQGQRDCPRMYKYRHELGLEIKRDEGPPAWALLWGIGFHSARECRDNAMMRGEEPNVDQMLEAFKKDFPVDQPAPMLKRGPGEALYTQIRAAFLLEEYNRRWEDDKDLVTVKAVEIGAAEMLTDDIVYCGRIDAAVEIGGMVRAVDLKTTSRMDRLTVVPNNQFAGYQWLLEQYFDNVGGVMVDIVGVYKSKAIEQCFDRQYDCFSREMIEDWKRETLWTVDIIREQRKHNIWPKNTDHCGAYRGRCQFLPLCTSATVEGEGALMETMYRVNRWEPYVEVKDD